MGGGSQTCLRVELCTLSQGLWVCVPPGAPNPTNQQNRCTRDVVIALGGMRLTQPRSIRKFLEASGTQTSSRSQSGKGGGKHAETGTCMCKGPGVGTRFVDCSRKTQVVRAAARSVVLGWEWSRGAGPGGVLAQGNGGTLFVCNGLAPGTASFCPGPCGRSPNGFTGAALFPACSRLPVRADKPGGWVP